MRKRNNFILGLLTGAAAGAVAGLLLAPNTGKENRQIIAARATEARQKVGDYVGSVRQRIRREQDPESTEEDSGNHVEVAGS